MSNKITSILPISGSLTVSGSILSSGNIDATGYSISASAYLGTITSASYAGTSSLLLGSIVSASYALTSSYSTTSSYAVLAQNVLGSITSASYALTSSYASVAQNVLGSISSSSFASTAYTASYATASWTGSPTAFNAIGAISASLGFSGSIASASFASSSYTTLTASAATSITFTPTTASYAVNAGTAQNANFAPNGFIITGTLLVSGNTNHVGYSVSASFFSGSIASSSFASSSYTTLTSSYALTSSFATSASWAPGSGQSTSASYASTASVGAPGFFVSGTTTHIGSVLINNFIASNVDLTITGSVAQTGNIVITGGNITASLGFSGSIASSSFASSSYTTLTASAATSITFIPSTASFATTSSAATSITFVPITSSYAANAGTAQNANFAPNGFIITGTLAVSGNANHTGYAVTASAFSGSIASSSFASSSYTSLTASAATSITFIPISSSYATTASYASVAQNVLGSITSASYAGTSSLGTPTFVVSGTLGVTGSINLNSSIATASLQILSNNAPFLNSGSYIELFDVVTDGDANKGNVNIAAGIPAAVITSGSTQAGINFYTSGTLQWRIGPSGNLDGIGQTTVLRLTGSVSASAFSGSIASASFASSSYTTLSSSYALSGSYASTSSLAITASFALSNAGTVTNATSASFTIYSYTSSYATASWTGSNSALNAIGAITASQGFSGSIASASFASSSYTTLTASAATSITFVPVSASYASTASVGAPGFFVSGTTTHLGSVLINNFTASNINLTITGSTAQSGNVTVTGGNVTASLGFSGSIASASFASSSYTTLTASAATSITFTLATASYSINAGTAQNANYAPNGFTITGSLLVSGNANHTGYNVTASAFSGSIASASFASSSYTSLTASAATSITFPIVSASYANSSSAATSITFVPATSSYALVAQNVLGSITSASYASTASYATPLFITSGTLAVTGNIQLNSSIATASLQLLSNVAATDISGAYIELFDSVTNGDANMGSVNIVAGLPSTTIISGSQGSINHYTSGNLQWNIDTAGNLNGIGQGAILMSGSASIGVSTFVASPNNEKLIVDIGTTTGFNIASFKSTVNNYAQLNVINRSVGVGSSADLVATNDSASEGGNYIDIGINSSNYTASSHVGLSNDAYIYSTGSDFYIGNVTPAANQTYINIFNGGFNADSFIKMRIHPEASIAASTTGSLIISTFITASAFNFTSGGILTAISNPSQPTANAYQIWARKISGRTMLKGQGQYGVDVVYQPAFFGNQIAMINAGSSLGSGSTALNKPNSIGCLVECSGTLTPVENTLDTIGYMNNISGALIIAAATSSCGVETAHRQFIGGFNASGPNGYFFNARLNFPDASASYAGNATTGVRAFVGLSGTRPAIILGSGSMGKNLKLTPGAVFNPDSSSICGFFYTSVGGGSDVVSTHWQFAVQTGVTASIIDTGVLFTTQSVYDMYIFSAPSGSASGSAVPHWRIDTFATGTQTTVEGGSFNNFAPSPSQSLYAGAWLTAFQATARTFNYQRIYMESDR